MISKMMVQCYCNVQMERKVVTKQGEIKYCSELYRLPGNKFNFLQMVKDVAFNYVLEDEPNSYDIIYPLVVSWYEGWIWRRSFENGTVINISKMLNIC